MSKMIAHMFFFFHFLCSTTDRIVCKKNEIRWVNRHTGTHSQNGEQSDIHISACIENQPHQGIWTKYKCCWSVSQAGRRLVGANEIYILSSGLWTNECTKYIDRSNVSFFFCYNFFRVIYTTCHTRFLFFLFF